MIKQFGIRCLFQIKSEISSIVTDNFRPSLQSLQASFGVVLPLGKDLFRRNYFEFAFIQHLIYYCYFGDLGVACWPLVPKFAGSNPAEAF